MGGRSLRMDGGKGIEDEYNFAEDTEKLKQQMFAENDEDDVEHSGSQSFLKVYKEGEAEELQVEKPLTKDDVKFTDDSNHDEVNGDTSGKSPMIAEIGSQTFDQSSNKK